ncbi:MAG: ion transporter [Gammaproteobacteria bacterium]|nr:ion transporter [Gammaproteobacteria bacterium]
MTAGSVTKRAQRIVASPWFNHGITGIILLNAAVIGLDTWDAATERFGDGLGTANQVFLGIFVIEALIKMAAHYPRIERYFRDGWNVFDFTIIVISLLPSTGELATVARLARLLRVLRLVSALPELRLIVTTLIRSIPSMFNVIALLSIIFYVYAVAGYHLFHEVDPTHWRNLGIALLSLFRIVTLEDWTDIMYAAMQAHWWAWAYFVSFVVMGTFVVVNLFIAVVLNNLDEAKQERLAELRSEPSYKEIVAELERTRTTLARLEKRLQDGASDEQATDRQPDARG